MAGAALAVSVLGALVVEGVLEGVGGADATEGWAVELGAEGLALEVDSVFNEAGAELCVAACVLGAGEVERGAVATLDRLELELAAVLDAGGATLAGSAGALGALARLRVGGAVAETASATLAGDSLVSVVVVDAASAGAEVLGAAPDSALLAVFTAGCGSLISSFL